MATTDEKSKTKSAATSVLRSDLASEQDSKGDGEETIADACKTAIIMITWSHIVTACLQVAALFILLKIFVE